MTYRSATLTLHKLDLAIFFTYQRARRKYPNWLCLLVEWFDCVDSIPQPLRWNGLRWQTKQIRAEGKEKCKNRCDNVLTTAKAVQSCSKIIRLGGGGRCKHMMDVR